MKKFLITLTSLTLLSINAFAENFNQTSSLVDKKENGSNTMKDSFFNHSFHFRNNSLNNLFNEWDNFFSDGSGIKINIRTEKTDKQYILKMEVPGYDADQIKLEVIEQDLVLSSRTIKDSAKDKNPDDNVREFRQLVKLPEYINKDAISSSLKNGLLTVIIPRIPVKAKEGKEIQIKI